MSPGCSNQDPKQTKVASGDLAGLLAMIEYLYYINVYIKVFNITTFFFPSEYFIAFNS